MKCPPDPKGGGLATSQSGDASYLGVMMVEIAGLGEAKVVYQPLGEQGQG